MDRLCCSMLAGVGFLSSAIIIAALFVMTASFDRYRTEVESENLRFVLDDWTNTLIAPVEEYAFADASYEAVEKRGDYINASAFESAADSSEAFDWVVILNADGSILYEAGLPENWDAAEYLGSEAYRPVLDQIALSHPSEYASVGGAFEVNGTHILTAGARITPDNFSGVDTSLLPYFIGGQNLDADALRKIAASIGSNRVFFAEETVSHSVSVEGPLGTVGALTWEAEQLGSHFRKIALPWVLAICTAIIVLTVSIAIYFRKLVSGFERMNKAATTDHLTGVANRAALSETLQTSVVQEALRGGHFAVISIDLDDFKQLNDVYGHHAGDAALRVAADRISTSMQGCERVFRMGGDEFLCMVLDPDPERATRKIVDRLKNAFNPPMDLAGHSQIVTPSIGVAIAHQGETWDSILERSDAAMYRAKRREVFLNVCLN